MNIFTRSLLAVILSGVLSTSVLAQGAPTGAAPAAYQTPAKAVYVVHPATGTVLVNVNGDARMGPASLTKMMTLYLIFDALKTGKYTPETLVPVSEKAWRAGGSKMFIEVGKQVPLTDLIRGIAIVSGNDACIAVAEFMGGTEEGFAGLMNAKARELGMTGSNFVNASGLPDPNQYTTAHDMARLLTAIFRDFPEYKNFMAEQEFTFNGIKQQNRNGLLRMGVGIDASKTGHTEESGYHLASTALQNNERLVAVVMGTDGFAVREAETLRAFRTFFSTYQTVTAFKPGEVVVDNVPVWHGQVGTTALTVAEPLAAYVGQAQRAMLKASVRYNQPLVAPAAADKPVGEITLTLPDGTTTTTALVPLRPLPAGGFIARFVQSAAGAVGL
jgi:serine-type D-Ala-D-Ala carboxypeptidase (penicillin-binding protein 5/6)